MQCSLCNCGTTFFIEYKDRSFYKCTHCGSILLDTSHYLEFNNEKERYDKHSDDIENEGYQQFVNPILEAVKLTFSETDHGLDYGCGKTAIIENLLKRKQYSIVGYDPIYFSNQEVLTTQYNYITCCEVAEHFYYPKHEFSKLSQLLLPDGKLFLKTYLFKDTIDFKSWWYKNDPTHVIFYTETAMKFIKKMYNFSDLKFHKNYIEFTK